MDDVLRLIRLFVLMSAVWPIVGLQCRRLRAVLLMLRNFHHGACQAGGDELNVRYELSRGTSLRDGARQACGSLDASSLQIAFRLASIVCGQAYSRDPASASSAATGRPYSRTPFRQCCFQDRLSRGRWPRLQSP